MPYENLAQAARLVLDFAPHAVVLQPPDLRETVRDFATQAVQLHTRAGDGNLMAFKAPDGDNF